MSELLTQVGPIDMDVIQPPQQVDSELRGPVYLADSTLSDGGSPVAVLFHNGQTTVSEQNSKGEQKS